MLDRIIRQPCPLPEGAQIVAYARDSGGEAQQDSISQQIEIYEQYASHHGLSLTQVYRDEALHGGSTDHRPGLTALLTDLTVRPGRVAGVLMWKINRLSRNTDDFQFIAADLRRRGFTLIFLADGIPDDDTRPIIEAIVAWKAQRDRRDMGIDIQRALNALVQRKNENGHYIGYFPGRVPYGYRGVRERIGTRRNGTPHEVQRIEPDPLTFSVAQQAWQMRARGASYREISEALPLFIGINSMTTFFDNEIYRGVLVYGGQRLPAFVAAACSEAEWEAVQRIRQRHVRAGGYTGGHAQHPRRSAAAYALTGLVYCDFCGAPMHGTTFAKGGGAYYRCPTAKRDRSACPAKYVREAPILAAIDEFMGAQLFTPEMVLTLYDLNKQAAARGPSAAEVERLQSQLRGMSQKIGNLINQIEDAPNPDLMARLRERQTQRDGVQAQLDVLLAKRREFEDVQLARETLVLYAGELAKMFEDAKENEKTRLRRAFVVRVDLKPGEAKVYFGFAGPGPVYKQYPYRIPLYRLVIYTTPTKCAPNSGEKLPEALTLSAPPLS